MREDAKDFMEVARFELSGADHDGILNMDQTLLPFSYHPNTTLDSKGVREVITKCSTNDTKRATLAASVTGSGKLLPPFLIFKGVNNGRIAQKEIPSYPEGCHYACQKKAWMDEDMMYIWIELVLIPWVQSRPACRILYLVLDSYRVHMMPAVCAKIRSLGIKIIHIPGGCTWLCLPVDIGVNRPIKQAMTEQWDAWMIDQGIDVETPTRELVAKWVVGTYSRLDDEGEARQKLANSWMKEGFEWF